MRRWGDALRRPRHEFGTGGGALPAVPPEPRRGRRALARVLRAPVGQRSRAGHDDDTGHTTVTGFLTSFFGGFGPYSLVYPFTNYSDNVEPNATAGLTFVGNLGNTSIAKATANYRTHFLGFPFEAVPSAADRLSLLRRFLTDCAMVTSPLFADGFETGDTSEWTLTVP